MVNYPEELQKLINHLKKLPGVGKTTAERFAFALLKWKEAELQTLGRCLAALPANIKPCPDCGCLISRNTCRMCDLKERDSRVICIISSPKDAYLIENTGIYRGLYHVIDSLLSPMEGRGIEKLHLEKLEARLDKSSVKEVVLALDSTLEGDATALFLKNHLQPKNLKISRLAFGLPVGSSLEYIDGGTLARALSGRQNF